MSLMDDPRQALGLIDCKRSKRTIDRFAKTDASLTGAWRAEGIQERWARAGRVTVEAELVHHIRRVQAHRIMRCEGVKVAAGRMPQMVRPQLSLCI